MKKQTKKILAAILSTGVIASTIGATLSNAASDVKVSLMQNEYIQYQFPQARTRVYMAKMGTDKNGRYFNQAESNYYKNVVKAANYYRDLGLKYENYTALWLYPDGYPRTPYTPDTVFISYSSQKGEAISELGMITIGPSDSSYMYDLEYVPDVLAHEYAHLLTQQVAGWDRWVRSSSNEAGAVVEAYSDILGELTESTPDWLMGADAFKNNSSKTKCYRNLKDPKSTKTPTSAYSYSSNKYYADYNEFKQVKDKQFDNNIAYGGSTVLSHAAYSMSQSGIAKNTIAEIWMDSIGLFKDPKNPTMLDCRNAVIQSATNFANDRGYSTRSRNELLQRVKWAFDTANIK